MSFARDTDISIPYLCECLEYIPPTLRWKFRPRHHFATEKGWYTFNGQFADHPAGTSNYAGYLRVTLTVGRKVRNIMAHRVIFALTYGRWPADEIDHKNRNKAQVQIANLRETTRSQNMQNTGLCRTNTSGAKGVSWYASKNKWQAYLDVNGRRVFHQYFDKFDDAVAARRAAERQATPFALWRSSIVHRRN